MVWTNTISNKERKRILNKSKRFLQNYVHYEFDQSFSSLKMGGIIHLY